MVRLQRLQLKEARANPSSHLTLSTLAEAAISLQPPKVGQVTVNTLSTKYAKD